MMFHKPRFAVIGCGKIAPRHAEQAAHHGVLAAVCDIIPERADALAAKYKAKAYYSVADFVRNEQNIDIAAICTPNGLHAEHSMLCLQAGAHVLCEKPLCIHSSDARKMIEAAERANKKLFVVKSTRYNPALAALKKLTDSNTLGKIYSFQMNCFWNRPPSYYEDSWKGNFLLDGGTLYTQFSHYIDAMLWIFGGVKSIVGFRRNIAHNSIIDFEDSGVVSLDMESGVLGGLNWSVNTFERNMEVSLSVIAEKGNIRIAGEYMNKVDYSIPEGLINDTGADDKANNYGSYKGSMSNHDKVYDNLMLALMDGQHPFTSAADGLKTVETIERIYNSVSL
jgi:UDP-N-acetyl-2-amino-2-deoxyglucuronate dehydrogenase